MSGTQSKVQQFAAQYINRGWLVVPLQGKGCVAMNWPSLVFTVDDFHTTDNIGIRSVNGLVFLDDDFSLPEVACADHFLPTTGAVYGRLKKPRSKRVYICPELTKSVTMTDIDGAHLVQLRVGLQDMAPPSVHPDTGEQLEWDGQLSAPRQLVSEELVAGARNYYAARLIGKYWPERGRHELRLAFARVLLESLGLPDSTAAQILEWACRLGGSDEKGIRDAAQAVGATSSKLDADQPTTGGRTVAAFLGDKGRFIVRALRKAYGKTDQLEEGIESLNESHAVLSVVNKIVVMETWPDGSIKTLWAPEEFKRRHAKESVDIGGRRRPLADLWLSDKRGRHYDRLVYVMPGGSERCYDNDYNGYLGFKVQPAAGEVVSRQVVEIQSARS